MKKLLGILVLGLLLCGTANAGLNEPGRGPVKMCESNFKLQHGIIIYVFEFFLQMIENPLSSMNKIFSDSFCENCVFFCS